MEFSLTPEDEMTRRIVWEFAEQEVAPVINDRDRAQTVNFHALSRMAELGILGMGYREHRPCAVSFHCTRSRSKF